MLVLKIPSYLKITPILLLKDSPWPIVASAGAFFVVSGAVILFHKNIIRMLLFGVVFISLAIYQWRRDIVRESSIIGGHSKFFQKALKIGILLFILSEVMFFARFFWGFFHRRTVPCVEIGVTWPPFGIAAINPYGIPLLNTVILLSSGVSVTWRHHSLQHNNFNQRFIALVITCLLGWVFLKIQLNEYYASSFTFADRVFGRVFFIATGFHGLHVFMGSVLLTISGVRLFMFHFSRKHHVGYEAAIWYWHFVDVVWLFLFCFVYFWGY